MRYDNRKFVGINVELDGNEYVGCTFTSCIFVYRANGRPVVLKDNRISADCNFRFAGAASDTVGMLKAIWNLGEWGRRGIIATFQSIAPGLQRLN
jgi:hypothetical protein